MTRPPSTRQALAALQQGTTLPPWEVGPLERSMFVRYAGASGDLNPLHFDDDDARAAGFERAFAPGMLVAGLVGTYLARLVAPTSVRKLKVRFVDQAYLGDVLTIEAKARTVAPTADGTRVVLAIEARRGPSANVLSGAAILEEAHHPEAST